MASDKRRNIVYSTDPDWKRDQEADRQPAESSTKGIGPVYLSRDKKGRRGKAVTLIEGLRGDLKAQLKELQRLCGAGGTEKRGTIEIQGDHRDKIAAFLDKKGFRVKFKGG